MDIDNKLCKEFVKSIKFEEIILNDLCIKRFDADEHENNNKVSVVLEFTLDKHECFFDEKKFTVYPKFNVSLQDAESEQVFSEINFSYEMIYSWGLDKEITEEYIRLFIGVNVQTHVWPYGRELISSMTTRMGYSPLIIEPYVK